MTVSWQNIIKFWFGEQKSDLEVAQEMNPRWWKKDPKVDSEIISRFEPFIKKAAAGELDEWKGNPKG